MSKQNSKANEPMGFSGIVQLVSRVQVDNIESTRVPPPQAASVDERPAPAAAPIYEGSTAEPQNSASLLKWIVGAVAVFTVIGLIANSQDDESKGSVQSTPYASPAATSDDSTAQVEPPVSVSQSETKPPVGQGHVLNVPQIRYCVAEDIRMGGAEAALKLSDELQVNTFNSMVEDYNSRCTSFQYRVGTLERVQGEMESRRELLRVEGAMRLQAESPAL